MSRGLGPEPPASSSGIDDGFMELTEQATFAVGSDAGSGALSIRLSGAWTLRRGLPSAERIEHEIAARRPSAVVFEVDVDHNRLRLPREGTLQSS